MRRKSSLMLLAISAVCLPTVALLRAEQAPVATDPIATPPADQAPVKKPEPAPAKPDPALEADIDKLIATLTEGEWKAQEKAVAKLAGVGTPAAPKLKALLEHTKDPDLITRVQGVLKQIDELQSFGPTTVSLDLKNATKEEAFKAFAEKSGIKFTPSSSDAWTGGSDKDKRITLKLEYEPYWAALLKLCNAAGAAPSEVTDGAVSIGAVAEKDASAPVAANGPFLLVARQVEATRRVVFGAQRAGNANINNGNFAGDGRSNYRLMLDACSEPKLKPISWSIDSLDCETDTGEQLASRNGMFGGEVNTPQSTTLYLMGTGDKPATRINKLTLKSHFVLLIKSKKIEINDLATAKESEHVLSGFRVVIRELKKQADDRYEIGFTAYRNAGTDSAWRDFTQLIQNRFAPQVADADGKPLNYAGGSSSSNGRELTITRMLMNRNFGAVNVGPPSKLIWDFPEETKTVQAEFVLKDLPLP